MIIIIGYFYSYFYLWQLNLPSVALHTITWLSLNNYRVSNKITKDEKKKNRQGIWKPNFSYNYLGFFIDCKYNTILKTFCCWLRLHRIEALDSAYMQKNHQFTVWGTCRRFDTIQDANLLLLPSFLHTLRSNYIVQKFCHPLSIHFRKVLLSLVHNTAHAEALTTSCRVAAKWATVSVRFVARSSVSAAASAWLSALVLLHIWNWSQ